MKSLVLSLAIFFLHSVVEAQIIVPILIPAGTATYNWWECNTHNQQAREYIFIANENFKTNPDVSLVYFQGAIKADSMFCDAYDYVAVLFIKKEDYESAMKYIDASLAINSSNLWARNTKSRLFLTMREYEDAGNFSYSQHMKQPEEGLWLYYLTESLFARDLLDSAKNTALKMQLTIQKQNPEMVAPVTYYMQENNSCTMKENAIARTALLRVRNNFYKDAVNNYYKGFPYEIAANLSMYLQGKIFCKMAIYGTAQRALLGVKNEFHKDADFNYYLGLTFLYDEKPDLKKAKKYITLAFKKGYEVPADIIKKLNVPVVNPGS